MDLLAVQRTLESSLAPQFESINPYQYLQPKLFSEGQTSLINCLFPTSSTFSSPGPKLRSSSFPHQTHVSEISYPGWWHGHSRLHPWFLRLPTPQIQPGSQSCHLHLRPSSLIWFLNPFPTAAPYKALENNSQTIVATSSCTRHWSHSIDKLILHAYQHHPPERMRMSLPCFRTATDGCMARYTAQAAYGLWPLHVLSLVQSLSHVRLGNPMDRSTPGLPVHHQPPEFTQTHVHRVGDAIQPSHPLSSLLFPPSIFPSIRVFSNESVLIRWPKYWSFNFSISPSNEYSGLISFRIDWFNLLAIQGTLKSLL